MRDVLKKLFDKGYLSEKASREEDFDLLPIILKKREAEQKRKIRKSKEKESEIDAFLEILEGDQDLFSSSEMCYLYNNIIVVEEEIMF